jgi:hypothetical protein
VSLIRIRCLDQNISGAALEAAINAWIILQAAFAHNGESFNANSGKAEFFVGIFLGRVRRVGARRCKGKVREKQKTAVREGSGLSYVSLNCGYWAAGDLVLGVASVLLTP